MTFVTYTQPFIKNGNAFVHAGMGMVAIIAVGTALRSGIANNAVFFCSLRALM
jgi:hypothetical protein